MDPTFLCIASYEKGAAYLRALKQEGVRVLFLTVEKLREADWPWESIDEVYFDAAKVDGASRLQQFRHILVPFIRAPLPTRCPPRRQLSRPV